ncbi:MAG: tetratricopeptide repeat protein [Gammaproteobacteria bacterium]|nr:tetratricopeptide repeat protein [Gammaproteobacteria bacterium]
MPNSEQNGDLLRELTRRKVFRSAAAYLVAAWLVIQVGSIVLPEFGAPSWAMRALIIVFVAGFPPAMILAWSVDFSLSGITRTADSGYSRSRGIWPRLAVLLSATLISFGMLWLAWPNYVVKPEQSLAKPEIKELAVIAVNPPVKLAGSAKLDWLGAGIANLMRSELADSRHAIVLSQSRWHALLEGLQSDDEIAARAREVGVDYLVDGEYLETPDGIVLTIHIEDLENGIEIHSARTKQPDAAGIIGSVAELGIRVKQALHIPHMENVGLFEADFAVAHVDAYEAYVAGLAFLVNFDYASAEEAFKAALDIAPDYHIARFRLAQVYEHTGRSKLARESLEEIPQDGPLSERERLYVEGANAYFTEKRDAKKAIEIYRKLVDLYPYETEAGTLLAEAYWLDFQDDAAIEEFRRLSRLHPYDPGSWMALGERLLDVGELAEAKAALEKYAGMQPRDGYAFALLGNLAALQGDLETSISHHEKALELKPGFPVARVGMARSLYLTGDWENARALWQLLVDDTDAAAGFRIDAAFDLSGVLAGRGLFAESMQFINAVMPLIREEGLRTALALTTLGQAELELGNTERAANLFNEAVAESPGPATRYLFARGTFELRTGNHEALKQTVDEIQELAAAADDPDLNEDKAASYLAGMLSLEQNDLVTAGERLNDAVSIPGYQYAVYKLGLASLLQVAGDSDHALTIAIEAETERDPGDLRLDLELDRARAILLQAEFLAERGEIADARERAGRFVGLWQGAAEDLPALVRARSLLALPAS